MCHVLLSTSCFPALPPAHLCSQCSVAILCSCAPPQPSLNTCLSPPLSTTCISAPCWFSWYLSLSCFEFWLIGPGPVCSSCFTCVPGVILAFLLCLVLRLLFVHKPFVDFLCYLAYSFSLLKLTFCHVIVANNVQTQSNQVFSFKVTVHPFGRLSL